MDRTRLNKRWSDWIIYQAGLPIAIFVLGAVWLWTLDSVKHPFEEALATGEPFLFSALLMLGVALELKAIEEQISGGFTDLAPLLHSKILHATPVVFLVWWAYIRGDMCANNYCINDTIPTKVTAYACGGAIAMVLALLLCVYSYMACTASLIPPVPETPKGTEVPKQPETPKGTEVPKQRETLGDKTTKGNRRW